MSTDPTSFTFVHHLEKVFREHIKDDKDFEHGRFDWVRLVDPFTKQAAFEINWHDESSTSWKRLVCTKVVAVDNNNQGSAFNIEICIPNTSERILSLAGNEEARQNELKRISRYIQAFCLIELRRHLPENTPFDANPYEILSELNPNKIIAEPKSSEEKTEEPSETTPSEETAQSQEPALAEEAPA